jgi:hypothetical protein
MSPAYPQNTPTTIDWSYWAERFPSLSPSMRRAHMLNLILSVLRAEEPPAPNEPRIYNRSTKSGVINDVVGPFFQRFLKFTK